MLKLAVLLTLLGTSLAGIPRITAPRLDGRIVGGSDTDIVHHPYQLALLYFGSHFCGAVIIASLYAVTAARCVESGLIDGLTVRAGSTYKSSGGQVVNVEDIFIHPQYDDVYLDNDIAVLLLARSITTGVDAAVATLPPSDREILEGQIATITGWGTLEYQGITPDILQEVEVPVIGLQRCQGVYGLTVTVRMFCAGVWQVGGKDACHGDSGGPVIINGVLAGLISWGSGCANPNYPGVYTSIPAHRAWITSVTGI